MIRQAALFVLACWGATAVAADLRRGNGIEPQTLDIHKAQGVAEQHVLRDLFEGLVAEGADGALIPGVALRWNLDATRRAYRFELRRDARWSNGDPVTAADFVFALRRAVAPHTGAPFVSTLFAIENAEAIAAGRVPPERLGVVAESSHVLTIRLERPTPYFLAQLALLTAYPLHEKSMRAAGDQAFAPGKLVGNGAYVLAEWKRQASMLLTKNPHFHDATNVGVARVTYVPTEDDATEFRQYRAGQLDVTSSIPSDSLGWARENLPREVRFMPVFGTNYLVCNMSRPPLADGRVRRALSMMVDRRIIAERIERGAQIAATSLVPGTHAGYRPARMPWADWSPARRLAAAKALLAEAGYGPGKPLTFEILYRTDENVRRRLVAMTAMWKPLDVRVRLRNEEWKVYLSSRRRRDFDVTVGSWVGEYHDPHAMLQILHSRAGPHINYSGYANPDYDALIDGANAEADPARRLRLLAEAEAIAMHDQPLLPVYFLAARNLVRPTVYGYEDNPLNVHPSRWISLRH